MKTTNIIRTAMIALTALFILTNTGCSGEVKVEVKDGCVTVTGIPSSVNEVTLTLEGPDEAWVKKGLVTNGKWGPHCFPRGFVGLSLNPGSITIDTVEGTDEKSYENKSTVRLQTGNQEIGFDRFKEK